jgi:hypothetical protein
MGLKKKWMLFRKLNHPAWQEVMKGLKKLEEYVPLCQHGSAL